MRRRSALVGAVLLLFLLFLFIPVDPSLAATPTPTFSLILFPTATKTSGGFGIQPSRTPTPPPSSVQTWTPSPTASLTPSRTPSPTPTPTLGGLTIASATPTAGDLAPELPPTATPHWDPYFTPEFPLTLPSPTPTRGTFKGPDVPDLYIKAVEVTQGMQNLDNDMPLVEARRTVARVYVCTDGGDWPDVRGGLQAWRDDQPLSPGAGEPAGKALLPVNGPITVHEDCGDRLDLDDSLYFYLPASWRGGDLTLRAFVYGTHPDAPFEQEKYDFNNFKTVYVDFDPAGVPRYRLYPLHMHEGYDKDNANVTFFPTEITFGLVGGYDIINDVYRLHPVAETYVELAGKSISPFAHGLGNEWKLDEDNEIGDPLDRLQWFRYWEDGAPWYVGMLSPIFDDTALFNGLADDDHGVAWVIMNPNHGTTTLWNVAGGATLAHELGHLKGLLHAPCADSDDDGEPDEPAGGAVDDDFPTGHPNCSLAPVDPDGFFGFDLYWDLWPFTSGPTVISNDPSVAAPNRGFPLMGYAGLSYPDAYHYCVLLEAYGVPCNPTNLHLGPTGGGGHGPAADCTPDPSPFPDLPKGFDQMDWELCLSTEGEPEWYHPASSTQLIVAQGQVDPGAGAAFDRVVLIQEPAPRLFDDMEQRRESLRRRGWASPYRLTLETADGTVLAMMPAIDTRSYRQAVGHVSFSEVLPFVPGGEVLRLREGDRVLAERSASVSPPEIVFLEPPSALAAPPIELHWRASDPDGDTLLFTLLYRPGPLSPWTTLAADLDQPSFVLEDGAGLAGSKDGQFRVVADDGFLTAFADSPAVYDLPEHYPTAMIHAPAEGLVFPLGGLVTLLGSAFDVEDGRIPDESLVWHSDRDGLLGTGREVQVEDLGAGLHTVSLSVTDSSGRTAASVVRIAVDPAVVRWRPGVDELQALEAVLAAAGGPGEPDEVPNPPGLPPLGRLAILAGLGVAGFFGVILLVLGLRRAPRRA